MTATNQGVMATEPARVVGAIGSVITAVLALLVVLGLDAELAAAILGVTGAAVPLIVGQVIREKVYAPATVDTLVKAGVEAGFRLSPADGEGGVSSL